jgi:hypothetical protein
VGGGVLIVEDHFVEILRFPASSFFSSLFPTLATYIVGAVGASVVLIIFRFVVFRLRPPDILSAVKSGFRASELRNPPRAFETRREIIAELPKVKCRSSFVLLYTTYCSREAICSFLIDLLRLHREGVQQTDCAFCVQYLIEASGRRASLKEWLIFKHHHGPQRKTTRRAQSPHIS